MGFPNAFDNRFRVLEELPTDKGFECFRVYDKSAQSRECLLRILPGPFSDDRVMVDEFHRFFSRFSEISSRTHVPAVYSFSGVAGSVVYVLEQYLSGTDLWGFVETRRTSPDVHKDVIEVLTKVCEGLHHAHQKGISHLCITAEDILINEDNPRMVKLVGFGTQIFAASKRLDATPEDSRLCMAPEVLAGKEPQPSSDIYSLALALKAVVPELFARGSILSKALSKNPSGRPFRARDFGYGLKEMLEANKVSVGREKTSAKTPGGLQPLLTIMTEPLGAEVKLNGKVLGITTAYGLSVPWKPGTSMEIGKPGFQTETLNFDVPFQETEITVQLQSALRLWTNPWGASVLVDGKPFGATTREGLVVPWHGCKIEILKNGYTSQILKFDSPPSEPETSVELQPVFSAALTVPKHHWMEIAGYLLGVIALMFLPVVFFIGMRGGSNLSQESDQLRQEISRLSFALSGKEQDNEALRQSNAQGSQEVRNLQDRVKQIESEKLVEKMAEGLSATIQSDRGQLGLAQQRLLEKDKEFQALKDELARNRAENRRQEEEIARLKTVSQQPPTVQRRFIDPQLSGQLLLACREGQTWMVDNLLAKGADPNARGLGLLAYTPLIVASRDGNQALVRLLLKHGADINLRAQSGWKAEDFARANNFHSVLTILRSHSP